MLLEVVLDAELLRSPPGKLSEPLAARAAGTEDDDLLHANLLRDEHSVDQAGDGGHHDHQADVDT